MKFENTDIWGFEHALRGMRNPKNSWDRSDSSWLSVDDPAFDRCGGYLIGPNDMRLAQSLIRAGSEHRKFLRQIMVSVDITAPFFWWKEFDTYKVGTTANSCSTMHKIHSGEISLDSFELGDYDQDLQISDKWTMQMYSAFLVQMLEKLRNKFLETGDARYWKELIRWLPEGWLQKRTVTMSYENLLRICSKSQRRNHKLSEWRVDFINWARSLPYAQEFLFPDELEDTDDAERS